MHPEIELAVANANRDMAEALEKVRARLDLYISSPKLVDEFLGDKELRRQLRILNTNRELIRSLT